MYRGRKISVVVPAHNEEKKIKDVITGIPEFVDYVVITDDCSSDATAAVALEAGDPRVTVIKHEQNTGVGGAIITSHSKALEFESEFNVVMAGDDQMDPKYLQIILDPLIDGTHGYVKGNRLSDKESFSSMPRYRVFGNFILSFLNKFASGYWNITDAQNGYTGISAEVLNKIDFRSVSQGYEFENCMLSRLNEHDIPVLDVAIPALYADEVSGINLVTVIPALLKSFATSLVKRIFSKYIKRVKIIPILSMAIFVSSLLSFFFGVVTLNLRIALLSAIGLLLSSAILSFYDYLKTPSPWKVQQVEGSQSSQTMG